MDAYIKTIVIILTINNFVLAFLLPLIRIKIRFGVYPVSFNQADEVQSYIGKVYFLCLFFIFFSAASFGFSWPFYQYFAPFYILENSCIQTLGVILNICSIAWIVIGQWQMEETWRIGIFEKEGNRIITTGLFRFSRHPIFVGLFGLMLSTFICMPNAITFMVFILSIVLINIEALLEEKELRIKQGKEYNEYCKKTRRWL